MRFAPTATGGRTAGVSISDDAAGSPHALPLGGTGTAPALSVSPASVAFGSQLVGTTSTAQQVTLTNSGTAPLAIAGLSLTGTNPADFSQTSGCPVAPATLAAGAGCAVSVRFAPTAVGGRSASLQVAHDAAGSPHTVTLSGTGSTSAIAFDGDLGRRSENRTGSTLTLTTTAAARAGARVLVFVYWEHASRTLRSVSGGGYTWTVDRQQKAAGHHGRVAIVSAHAPSGLPAGTTLTATFTGSVTRGLVAAASFTGLAASGRGRRVRRGDPAGRRGLERVAHDHERERPRGRLQRRRRKRDQHAGRALDRDPRLRRRQPLRLGDDGLPRRDGHGNQDGGRYVEQRCRGDRKRHRRGRLPGRVARRRRPGPGSAAGPGTSTIAPTDARAGATSRTCRTGWPACR